MKFRIKKLGNGYIIKSKSRFGYWYSIKKDYYYIQKTILFKNVKNATEYLKDKYGTGISIEKIK